MKQTEVFLAEAWPQGKEAAEKTILHSRLMARPSQWEVSFPKGEDLRWLVFEAAQARRFGMVIYRFSNEEARFIFRGEFEYQNELVACLAEAEQIVRELGCSQLVTQEKIRPEWLEADRVMKSNGFEQLDQSWVLECPFTPFEKRLNRIMSALQINGSIPKEARVSDLQEGMNLARVLLEEASLMDGFEFDALLGASATKHVSAAYSQLVWVGQTLAGIILVAPTATEGTYEIPIRFILPAFRQTWVNTLLLHACVQQGVRLGATTIRFNANAKTHRETMRLAEMAGCVRTASLHRYGKKLSILEQG